MLSLDVPSDSSERPSKGDEGFFEVVRALSVNVGKFAIFPVTGHLNCLSIYVAQLLAERILISNCDTIITYSSVRS